MAFLVGRGIFTWLNELVPPIPYEMSRENNILRPGRQQSMVCPESPLSRAAVKPVIGETPLLSQI